MSDGNVTIVQLGPKQIAISLNKNSLLQIKEGRALGIDLEVEGKKLRFILIRDNVLSEKLAEFRSDYSEVLPTPFAQRVKKFFKTLIPRRQTPHQKALAKAHKAAENKGLSS